MDRLKIILDCDGVLADTIQKVLQLYNSEYGLNLKKEDIVTWDLKKIQKKGTNLTKYFNQKGFFRDLDPIEDSRKYVKMLQQDGHEIFVATAVPFESVIDRITWLKENFEFIPEENILFAQRKDVLYADVILDDGVHNLANSQCDLKVVYDQPWNRKNEDFIRVYSWEEFYRLIGMIVMGKKWTRKIC